MQNENEGFFEFLYTWTPSKFSVQQLAFFAAMIAMTLEKVEKRWQRSVRRRRRVVFGKAALGREVSDATFIIIMNAFHHCS